MRRLLLFANIWHIETTTDFSRQVVGNFDVAGHGFYATVLRIGPKGMLTALALEDATELAQMSQQRRALHPTVTVDWMASAGAPRKPSSRRSSRMRAIASARLALDSSIVRPWPFAPGISRQYALNHSPSRSTTAVNSFFIREIPARSLYAGPELPVTRFRIAQQLAAARPGAQARGGWRCRGASGRCRGGRGERW